jgi:hypothetical protein
MSSLRPVGRSAATLDKDRVSACRFTFADGRQCRTPRVFLHFFSVSSVPRFVLSVLILFSFSLFSDPVPFTRSAKNLPQIMPALTHLNATLANYPISIDSKQLTVGLNPSESTLMKNIGGWGVMVSQISE